MQLGSLEEADAEEDGLAASGKLDPALSLSLSLSLCLSLSPSPYLTDIMANEGSGSICLLQVGSLEEADAKIDALAASGQLDPALLLTMAKAYSGVKDTDVTREEVKDIMAHLYFKVRAFSPCHASPFCHATCLRPLQMHG